MPSSASTDAVTVDFYFGPGSRYSYLASTQLAAIEAKFGCLFIWKPVASGRLLMKRRGAKPFDSAPTSGQYDWTYREYDAKCWAACYGVPFREPQHKQVPPEAALACLAAGAEERTADYATRLYRAIYVEGHTIDEALLVELAEDIGLETDAFMKALSAEETAAKHEALVDEALFRGAFGVPTFFLGQRMFWGNDRLPLLKAVLSGADLPPWQPGHHQNR